MEDWTSTRALSDPCTDAWSHIATFLLPIDIVALGDARKATRACVRRALTRVLRARLAALLPPSLGPVWPPGLCLSGSACWHAMAGEGWQPGDLELFCPAEQTRVAQIWLERAGFFLYSAGVAYDPADIEPYHGVANFYRWPEGTGRIDLPLPLKVKCAIIGLDVNGRMSPDDEFDRLGSLCHIRLVIVKPNEALGFDLPILCNTYDGKVFVVQRPDLVNTRTCDMYLPPECHVHRNHETHILARASRVASMARYHKYMQRGMLIRRIALPCELCGDDARAPRKRKANSM